jgi:hypothetical protein
VLVSRRECTFSLLHRNEFIGTWRAAAESVLARAVVHIARWVCEGVEAKKTGEISRALRWSIALKQDMPAVCRGFQRPG